MIIYYPNEQYGTWIVSEFKIVELWKRMDTLSLIRFLKKCYKKKHRCQDYCDKMNYEKWWHCMTIPLMDIPQKDLEWACKQKYNSYTSQNGFLQEIERRKSL